MRQGLVFAALDLDDSPLARSFKIQLQGVKTIMTRFFVLVPSCKTDIRQKVLHQKTTSSIEMLRPIEEVSGNLIELKKTLT